MEIAALFSGVCKVNAAIGVQLLVDLFGADMIINSERQGGWIRALIYSIP